MYPYFATLSMRPENDWIRATEPDTANRWQLKSDVRFKTEQQKSASCFQYTDQTNPKRDVIWAS